MVDDSTVEFENFVFRLNVILGSTLILALSSRSSTSKFLSREQLLHPVLLRFLSVYVLFAAGDWCQGPYFHAIYVQKNISEQNIAMIFTSGYVSATLLGYFAGSWADVFGRKKCCAIFGFLFIASAFSTSSSRFDVLILGRLCGGAASALLHTAPEAWFVSEMKRHDVPSHVRLLFFGAQHFFSFLSAICVGQTAHHIVSRFDTFATFQLSAGLVCLGSMIMFFSWKENYGSSSSSSKRKDINVLQQSTFGIVCKDVNILLVGATQSFFDSAVYVFVLLWSSMLRQASVRSGIERVPFGQIFSAYMMSLMIGSCVQDMISRISRKYVLLCLSVFMILAAACLSLCTLQSVKSNPISLVLLFSIFEFVVGVYKPVLTNIRSVVIPCHVRSAIMSLCRVPLNLKVILTYSAFSAGLCDQDFLVIVASSFIVLSSISVFVLWNRGVADNAEEAMKKRK
jgi:MFS transporter, MFS domain-containing protein family, molybdate-anion transporter